MNIRFSCKYLFFALASALLCAATAGNMPEQKERFFAYRSFWPEFGAMKSFSENGVNTITIMPSNTTNSLGEPYCKYPVFWRGEGKYDWKSFDRQFDGVISANPNARIVCIVDLNSPPWLMRKMSFGHTFDSDSFSMLSNSVSCRFWKKATERFLIDYLEHTEKKYGGKIAAYMLACGHTDEWLDYTLGIASPCKISAWREWLKRNKKPQCNIPPYSMLCNASFENTLRDPSKESASIDFIRFSNEIVADAMIRFAEIAREKISKDKQLGAFFGYVHRFALDGHSDYERVFANPAYDFFVSPGTYGTRAMGEGSGFMAPNGTRTRLGKGWFHEIDHRTHTFNHQLSEYVRIVNVANWKNQKEDDAGLKREFSLATINHSSLWCFDMWGNVFSTPETLSTVRRARQIWGKYKNDNSPTAAEIAIFADMESGLLVNQNVKGPTNHLKPVWYNFIKTGAPVEIFSFGDIGKADLSKYKVIAIPQTFLVTPERRTLLKKFVLCGNKTVITTYAPAICDGKNLDVSRVKEFCGFEYGTKGVNKKQMDGWKSVYFHNAYDATTEELRKIAEEAGVHFYVDENVPVFANEKLLCVHVKDGGKKTVRLKKKHAKITELFSGKTVAENADSFEYDFDSPDTALFELSE